MKLLDAIGHRGDRSARHSVRAPAPIVLCCRFDYRAIGAQASRQSDLQALSRTLLPGGVRYGLSDSSPAAIDPILDHSSRISETDTQWLPA